MVTTEAAEVRDPVAEPSAAAPASAQPAGPIEAAGLHPALRPGPFAIVFLLFFAALVVWAIATPVWGSPDEFQHANRAYAAVRGQVYIAPTAAADDTGGFVNAPAGWLPSQQNYNCYAGPAGGNPACLPPITDDSTPVRTASTAARYDPVYYLIVGLPSLVLPLRHALQGMRVVSAALSAVLLAWALTGAMTTRRARLGAAAVLMAVTPMVLFMGAAINPNGLEISGALCTWVCLTLALRAPPGRTRAVLLRRASLAACAFVVTRGLSPLWLLVIAVVVALFVGLGSWRRMLARDVVRWAAVVGVVSVLAVLWTVVDKTLYLGREASHTSFTFSHRLDLAWGGWVHQRWLLYGAVGDFGWLDTPLTNKIVLPFLFTAGLILLWMLVAGRWSQRAALVLLAACALFIPVLLDANNWNAVGHTVWQSRYTLPISVGLVCLAGLGLAERLRPNRLSSIIAPGVLVTIAVWTNTTAFAKSVSRYVVGLRQPIQLSGGHWQPPLGGWTVVILESSAWILLAVVVLVLGTPGLIGKPSDGRRGRLRRRSAQPQ